MEPPKVPMHCWIILYPYCIEQNQKTPPNVSVRTFIHVKNMLKPQTGYLGQAAGGTEIPLWDGVIIQMHNIS